MQPLHAAIKNEHVQIALTLLEIDGINVNTFDSAGDTPLISAMENELLSVAERLIAAGADVQVNSKSLACSSLIHHVASRGNVGLLKMLSKAPGFDSQMFKLPAGPLHFTPLHLASRGGKDDMCRFLLPLSDVSAMDKNGKTPAQLAEKNRKLSTAELIQDWCASSLQ